MSRPAVLAVGMILGLLAWRIGVLAGFPYNLYGDEAQYWTWAQALDWGYYSKPPVVAWLIAASTAVCGDGIFCIKLPSALLYAATSLLIHALAARLYGPREALAAAGLFALMPAVSLGSLLITTDAPLLFFWALGLLAFTHALERRHDGWDGWLLWLLVGVAGGLGMLSKYSMSFFAVSVFLFLLSQREHRHWLLRPQPWVGALVAALLYLPNLWWNARHGFASYRHTHEISQVEQARLSWPGLTEFLGAQFVVLGPVVFAVLLYGLFRMGVHVGLRGVLPGTVSGTGTPVSAVAKPHPAGWQGSRVPLLVAFFLPWFLLVLVLSLLSRTHGNWAVPAYVSAVILVAAWLTEPGRWRARLLWTSLGLHLLFAAGLYHYEATVAPLLTRYDDRLDPLKRIRGWDVLGQEVHALQQQYPEATLLTQDRMLTAQLMYYGHPPMQPVVKWNPEGRIRDHYDLTTTMLGREGQDFLLVQEGDRFPEGLQAFFTHTETLTLIQVPLQADHTRLYGVFHLQGFLGYPTPGKDR